MALFSSPISSSSLQHPNFIPKFSFPLFSSNRFSFFSVTRASSSSSDTGFTTSAEAASEPVTTMMVKEAPSETPAVTKEETPTAGNVTVKEMKTTETVFKFQDARWIKGTWDLKQFEKEGKTDWDSVIVAEAKRRKWLEENPETTTNDEAVIFDTSIIPWWAWIKRYHLPEAELLNGRAAMIGFFMTYFVDSLTGVGLVGQMGNFFCKTLLFVAVAGVLLIRKNEDVDKLKQLFDETTLYDKQWQAAWKDDESLGSRK